MDAKADIRLGPDQSILCQTGNIVAFGNQRDLASGTMDRVLNDANGWPFTIYIATTDLDLPVTPENVHPTCLNAANALKDVSVQCLLLCPPSHAILIIGFLSVP